MKDQDRAAFGGLMAYLCEMYREEFSELRLDGYFRHLREYELEDLGPAIEHLIASQKYAPRVSEIRDVVAQIKRAQKAAHQEHRALKQRPDYVPNFEELRDQLVAKLPKMSRIGSAPERETIHAPTPEEQVEHEAKKRRAIANLEEFRRHRSSESA